MNHYSEEEFYKVFHDITDTQHPVFDSLVNLAQETLKSSVKRWCYEDSCLRGGSYEDDVMQEILIRLIKNCVSGFFMRDGKLNNDPDGFKNWMFTVAKNVKNDFAKKIRRMQFIESELDENLSDGTLSPIYVSSEAEERLSTSFRRVIDSDISIYKVLTWIAQMLIIANMNVTKIQSNDILVQHFGFLTLDNMLEMIVAGAKDIPWLSLSDEQLARLRYKLDETTADGVRLGDKTYSDFYMKKGPKATVSDWVNRINNFIAKEDK